MNTKIFFNDNYFLEKIVCKQTRDGVRGGWREEAGEGERGSAMQGLLFFEVLYRDCEHNSRSHTKFHNFFINA